MGKVMGMHAIELKPEANANEFETFMTTKLAPLYERVSGQRAYLVKGDRGERAGKYMLVIEIESPERRDQIYPLKEDGWGISDEAEEILKETQPIWDNVLTYVVDFPDTHFTDYVSVSS